MMIDYTFFQDGLLRVDGALALAAPSPTNEALRGFIESFIDRYEPEYLCKLLGEELYNDFLAFEEGDESEYSKEWDEFKSLVVKGKNSPIANYVYFFMLRHANSTATFSGVKVDGENLVSPQRKMIFAWNDMVNQNIKIYSWLCKKFKKVYSEQELFEIVNEFNV